MLKIELSHVIKTFVESLLPTSSGEALLAVGLRVDTWLNIDEDKLTDETRSLLEAQPRLYPGYCQRAERIYEVLIFRRQMAYTQVYRQQVTTNKSGFSIDGCYDKIADHDSTWIEAVGVIHDRALEAIQNMLEDAISTVQVEHQARLRPGQYVNFVQPPALVRGFAPTWVDDQLILHPQQK